MTRREILLKAIEVIEERGWAHQPVKQDFSNGSPVCIQAAVCVAGGRELSKDDVSEVYSYAHTLLGNRNEGSTRRRAWRWNDHPNRTKEEVIAALRFLADTDMSWDDAIDLWQANENLSPLYDKPTVEEPVLAAV